MSSWLFLDDRNPTTIPTGPVAVNRPNNLISFIVSFMKADPPHNVDAHCFVDEHDAPQSTNSESSPIIKEMDC